MKLDDSIAEYKKALGIHQKALGPEHPETGGDHHGLGLSLAAKKRKKDAIAELSQALASYRKAYTAGHALAREVEKKLKELGVKEP